ncbi:MAG TPA: Gfo/Idh/MocA family oxidoreductase [Bryobacteraceae bacterium]|nr:Gfo/Idh/MocA family oxidoreductase [Bryobacteraceae bacterium]
MKDDLTKSSRRDLLRFASLTTLGAGLSQGQQPKAQGDTVYEMKFEPKKSVRMGFIGLGGRGTGLMRNFAAVDGVEVQALCDIDKERLPRAQAILEKLGHSKVPTYYHQGERAFEELAKRDDIDLVCVGTPWNWHVPMAAYAMKQGKHVAVEVPAATTIEECWELVNTSEKTRRHCVMLENCCYGYNELLVLNMVRAGVFGDLTHGACAYNHDLRDLLFSDRGEGLWRRTDHIKRNGNLYPTHGLGPVANYMDINRGDKFESMVSMSSPAISLAYFRDQKVPANDPRRKETYRCGDMNISLIKTTKGRLITLEHNVTSPQPYDRINLISGVKGIFRDYPPRIYLDSMGKHEWGSIDSFKAQYEHPYWKELGETARKLGGHGGMDFIECYRLIQCMKEGIVPDMDVYDAAAWSAPGPLSDLSVAKNSAPVPFPDFTRGRWKETSRAFGKQTG